MAETAQFPQEQANSGEFTRQEDAFRDWVEDRSGATHPLESGRYHLYVSLACPWAHRALLARNFAGLQEAVGVTVVDPVRDERGWAFRDGPGHSKDPMHGFQFLREAYEKSDPEFAGRVTVPVLWDRKAERIVNNAEDDLCRMFAGVFRSLAETPLDWFPEKWEDLQRGLAEQVYEHVNNGVYRAGFATRQEPYEEAVRALFGTLDELEVRLQQQPFLLGDRPVEVDWRLFCTGIRFDAVYHGHFKCNMRRWIDYPELTRHLRTLYGMPGVAETVRMDHIKRHYYLTHKEINPTGIVPLGPLSFI